MDHFAILLLALLLDVLVGDPHYLYRVIPHPIVLLGQLISIGEKQLNRGKRYYRLFSGALLTGVIIMLAALIAWLITIGLESVPGGWFIEAVIASTLIAWRSLYDHVNQVASGLLISLDAGREAVSHIVGRDPNSLDEAGVARAAVESAAENFSDGVVAPVFWYALLGLPGIFAYKAVNTLDSMIGHRNPRYEAFGKVAARLDDIVNYLPARLAGLLFVGAAYLLPGASGLQAWRTMRRDARKHRSPNAGWQESAVAGALGFALAGPRRYADHVVDDAWMGDGRRELSAADIKQTLALYCLAGGLLFGLIVIAALWNF